MARMDRRTPEQVQADIQSERDATLPVTTQLLYALHDAGFRSVWIDSSQNGDSFWQQLVIDQTDINHDDMMKLHDIAMAFDARIFLRSLRMNQDEFSRICLWPVKD